jgi:hypothetical protein
MARTYRVSDNQRRPVWSKEAKQARKQTNRKARYNTKKALRDGDELYPQYRGTSGWLTH